MGGTTISKYHLSPNISEILNVSYEVIFCLKGTNQEKHEIQFPQRKIPDLVWRIILEWNFGSQGVKVEERRVCTRGTLCIRQRLQNIRLIIKTKWTCLFLPNLSNLPGMIKKSFMQFTNNQFINCSQTEKTLFTSFYNVGVVSLLIVADFSWTCLQSGDVCDNDKVLNEQQNTDYCSSYLNARTPCFTPHFNEQWAHTRIDVIWRYFWQQRTIFGVIFGWYIQASFLPMLSPYWSFL